MGDSDQDIKLDIEKEDVKNHVKSRFQKDEKIVYKQKALSEREIELFKEETKKGLFYCMSRFQDEKGHDTILHGGLPEGYVPNTTRNGPPWCDVCGEHKHFDRLDKSCTFILSESYREEWSEEDGDT
jgi:hypothetical protein